MINKKRGWIVSQASSFDQGNNIDIKPDKTHKEDKFHISKAEANSWSVFQALYELTEHVKPIAGIPETSVFKKVVPRQERLFTELAAMEGKKCLKCTWVLSSLLTGT